MQVPVVGLILLVIVIVLVSKTVKIVPQQHAWVLERLGRYHATLTPGLTIVLPFIDRVAYKHVLKEIPLDVPSQICITRDNTQLQVDGVLYFQVTDPMKASYGSSNFVFAITQLSQTTLRSVIGKLELDKTFEERDFINHSVVSALDEAASNWGVKVLRYEIKDLTPPKEILHAMQAQITAEREKRALIAASEGRKQEQINLAAGAREAAIQKSEGERQAAINQAQGRGQPEGGRAVCDGFRQPGEAGQYADRAGQYERSELDDRLGADDREPHGHERDATGPRCGKGRLSVRQVSHERRTAKRAAPGRPLLHLTIRADDQVGERIRRAFSRCQSRCFSVSRLSCSFLPLARPISHFTRPPL